MLAALFFVSTPPSTRLSDAGVGDDAIPGPADSPTVVFGAVGDFDNKAPNYVDMVALAKRLGNRGGLFLLSLGDLGYNADEQTWCAKVKGAFNATLVVAGNHDTTENGPGDINNAVIYCPFNVDSNLVPGPTYGYGKSYYFDYPRTNPLVRVIMITAGTTGTQVSGQNYGKGGAEYNWVVDAVNNGRTAGVPWVVVGLHKMCITVGTKSSCEMGQALFDKLVDLRVDLILQAHDHVYERSKQLALNPNCTSILSGGHFDADCIVASGRNYVKGNGSVAVVNGAGGRDLYTVRIDGSDPEIGYFDEVMGTNANTQGKSNGHGPLVVTLNATTLSGTTAFCPLGTGDAATGECPSKVPTTFADSFTIASSTLPPPPLGADFAFIPAAPATGQTVTFTASANGGVPPYTYAWHLGDGSTGEGTPLHHEYANPGSYSVNLTVTDSLVSTANATHTVTVSAPPPLSCDFTFSPSDPDIGQTVTFIATASGGTPPYAYAWQLGDGSTGSGPTLTHAYAATGSYVVNLTVTDVASGTARASRTVVVAQPPPPGSPSAAFTVSPAWPQVNATVTFNASGSTDPDPSETLRYRWDWTDDGTWDTAWAADPLSSHAYPIAGRHTARLEVQDNAGLTDTASALVPVDGSPPTTTSTVSGPRGDNGWYRGAVTVTLAATDEIAGVAATWDRRDNASWNQGTSTTFTSDRMHTLDYYSTDRSGWAETIRTAIVPVDQTPPTTACTLEGTKNPDGTYEASVKVNLAATDPLSGVGALSYRIDQGTWQVYSATLLISANGSHVVSYFATDGAGNAGSAESASLMIANGSSSGPGQLPLTTLSLDGTRGAAGWYVSPVTAALSATSPLGLPLAIHYRLDGGLWTTYVAPFTLPEGAHILEYNATDAASQTEPTRSAEVWVDTLAPVTSAGLTGTRGRDHWYTSPVNVTLSASDATSGPVATRYRLDAGVWQAYASSFVVGSGRHTLEYGSVDGAGNWEAFGLMSLKIDSMPPKVRIVNEPGTRTSSEMSLLWEATDDLAGVAENWLSLDSIAYVSVGTSHAATLSLADGPHVARVMVMDDAGNTAVAELSVFMDTNPFSPTGPYGGLPLYSVLVAITLLLVMATAARRRRRRKRHERALAMRQPSRRRG